MDQIINTSHNGNDRRNRYYQHKTHKQMDNQSLMHRITKDLLEYSSCECVCCQTYKLNTLLIYKIADIVKVKNIPKVNHYYSYNITHVIKCYLTIIIINMY